MWLGELFSIEIADGVDEKVQFTTSMPCNETCSPFGQHSMASVRVRVRTSTGSMKRKISKTYGYSLYRTMSISLY